MEAVNTANMRFDPALAERLFSEVSTECLPDCIPTNVREWQMLGREIDDVIQVAGNMPHAKHTIVSFGVSHKRSLFEVISDLRPNKPAFSNEFVRLLYKAGMPTMMMLSRRSLEHVFLAEMRMDLLVNLRDEQDTSINLHAGLRIVPILW